MLLAMATGTGKTKTSIALIYRLLKLKFDSRIFILSLVQLVTSERT
jgi:type I site-specific restriction endonuclease